MAVFVSSVFEENRVNVSIQPSKAKLLDTEGKTFKDLFDLIKSNDRPVVKCTISDAAKHGGVEVEMDMSLKVATELNYKYVNFFVKAESEPPKTSNKNDAFKYLMQKKVMYPAKPLSSSGQKLSGPQQMKADIIDWIKEVDDGWTPETIQSGTNTVNKLTNALWYIDHCHDKLKAAACPVPSVFSRFQHYNKFQLLRRKKPTVTQDKLNEICQDLIECLSYPSMMTAKHQTLADNIDDLLQCLSKFKDRLSKDNYRHKEVYHQRMEPSVSLETDSTLSHREPVSFVGKQYRALDCKLQELSNYSYISLDEFSPLDKEERRKYLRNLQISKPLVLFRVCYGGSIGTLNFVWTVEEGTHAKGDSEKNAKVIASISSSLPQYSSRAMRRDFIDKYQNYVKTPKGVLRHMFNELTGNENSPSNAQQAEIDDRIAKIILSGNDTDLLLDYRSLNGKELDEKYGPFFEEVGKYFEEQLLVVHERRHGEEMYLPLAISMEDLKSIVSERLPQDTPIPSTETLRLQFQPSNPFSKTALRYTGRFDVKFRVQTRQARVHHPDSHYVASLFKYLKHFCVKYQDNTTFICLDDKAIIPVGEPHIPISTGVRAHNKVLAPVNGPSLVCSDHDFHIGGIVPSVTLVPTIPDSVDDSFFSGKVFVTCKDKVFEPSNPFRHAAETIRILRDHFSTYVDDSSIGTVNEILCLMTDGGPDHRLTFESVKISLIEIFMQLDLDMLIAIRTAPNHSWVNPAERCMSILNLALQHVALSRTEMEPTFESMIKHKNSLNAVRNAAECKQGLRIAFKDSMETVLNLVVERFKHMKLKGQNFNTYRGASDEEIDNCLSVVRDICDERSKDKISMGASSKDLKDIKELQAFIDTHGKSTHYSFQLKKCALESQCQYCLLHPVRMNGEIFKGLSFLPCPVPDSSKEHYQSFDKLYGQEVDESHRPSKKNTNFDDELVDDDKHNRETLIARKVRGAIKCGECGKARLVYCDNKLTDEQEAVLQRIQDSGSYICGDAMTDECKFIVRRCLTCATEIEVSYYSSPLRSFLPLICIYCGSDEGLLDDNNPYIADLYEKFSVVRPLCGSCRLTGKEAKTWGRKFFKKQKKQ